MRWLRVVATSRSSSRPSFELIINLKTAMAPLHRARGVTCKHRQMVLREGHDEAHDRRKEEEEVGPRLRDMVGGLPFAAHARCMPILSVTSD
jgi:hypothetical protein